MPGSAADAVASYVPSRLNCGIGAEFDADRKLGGPEYLDLDLGWRSAELDCQQSSANCAQWHGMALRIRRQRLGFPRPWLVVRANQYDDEFLVSSLERSAVAQASLILCWPSVAMDAVPMDLDH